MNYELKTIKASSVFTNALRIFLIIGFLVSILSIYILKTDPRMDAAAWWQKLLLTVLYTVVYDLVLSTVLAIIALLYNFWTSNFKGVSVYFEQE